MLTQFFSMITNIQKISKIGTFTESVVVSSAKNARNVITLSESIINDLKRA
ncbi:hypothetical protein CLAUR_038730 [Clostridium felsineum]|nr:hypothetical protein CLAUR_038730 [Clostridium felsineum]